MPSNLKTVSEVADTPPTNASTLDLDDGVKVNYAKFGDLRAKVKTVCGAKDEE